MYYSAESQDLVLEVVLWEVNIHGHACDLVGIAPLGVLQNLHYPIHAQGTWLLAV